MAPLYEQVADRIRTEIRTGQLAPGARLAGERELLATYDVSRNTLRQAVARLVSEGLLIVRQGSGTYVREDRPLEWHASHFEGAARGDDAAAGLDAWSAAVAAAGREPRQDVVAVEIVQPPPRVAENLDLDPKTDHCVVRRRIRYVDAQPYMLADSYFPEPLARGTPLMEPRDVVASRGILASIGHPQHHWRDEIITRMPTADETDRLAVPPGTAVAEHLRTGWAAGGQPLRVMVTILPGDRNILIYESDPAR